MDKISKEDRFFLYPIKNRRDLHNIIYSKEYSNEYLDKIASIFNISNIYKTLIKISEKNMSTMSFTILKNILKKILIINAETKKKLELNPNYFKRKSKRKSKRTTGIPITSKRQKQLGYLSVRNNIGLLKKKRTLSTIPKTTTKYMVPNTNVQPENNWEEPSKTFKPRRKSFNRRTRKRSKFNKLQLNVSNPSNNTLFTMPNYNYNTPPEAFNNKLSNWSGTVNMKWFMHYYLIHTFDKIADFSISLKEIKASNAEDFLYYDNYTLIFENTFNPPWYRFKDNNGKNKHVEPQQYIMYGPNSEIQNQIIKRFKSLKIPKRLRTKKTIKMLASKTKEWNKEKYVMFCNKMLLFKIKKFLTANKRYFIIPLCVIVNDTFHANVLIYDKVKQELERFNPNGNTESMGSAIDYVCKQFGKENNLIKDDSDYISPYNLCPNILANPQSRQDGNNSNFKGSCATWCMWYIHLRLSNPNVNREEILEYASTKINSKNASLNNSPGTASISYSKFIENYLKKFNVLVSMIKKYPNRSIKSLHKIKSN